MKKYKINKWSQIEKVDDEKESKFSISGAIVLILNAILVVIFIIWVIRLVKDTYG